MSFGFVISNANRKAVVSDKTYNPVYIGRAYYTATEWTATFADNSGNDQVHAGQLIDYRIDNCPHDPLPFFNATNGNYCSVVGIESLGNNSWKIALQVYPIGFRPSVWVFAKVPVTAPAGNSGLVIYDANGNIAFDSNQKNLLLTDFISATVPGIACVNQRDPNGNTAPCATGQANTNFNVAIPAIPAICYPAIAKGNCYDGNLAYTDYQYISIATVYPNYVNIAWGIIGYTGSYGYNFDCDVRPVQIMLIDGNKYP